MPTILLRGYDRNSAIRTRSRTTSGELHGEAVGDRDLGGQQVRVLERAHPLLVDLDADDAGLR